MDLKSIALSKLTFDERFVSCQRFKQRVPGVRVAACRLSKLPRDHYAPRTMLTPQPQGQFEVTLADVCLKKSGLAIQ